MSSSKMAMPALTVRRRDGGAVALAPFARPTLVHVWATWCPPCRAELPGLLALPSEHAVDVVAIALDDRWGDVDRFLDDLDASSVVLGSSEEVERVLGVRSLPVTFFVQADGRISLRFDGARDWTDEAFVEAHVEAAVDVR
ncbi:TlpA family protein disulfide reductase [Haliangium sp.]|uniref:TlpA family protein disulfide reductase n=1 Tax=Haliangium sp. TaxID=2663208 RepID=UPI003D0CFC35